MIEYIVPGASYQFLDRQTIDSGRTGHIFNDLDLFADAGHWIGQTSTGPPVLGNLNKHWRNRSAVQRLQRGDMKVVEYVFLDGSLDLVNDPNAYSHIDTWRVLGKVIANYRGYEKFYGTIPRLKIRPVDDIEAATVSFGDGPPSSIPLGIILEDGTVNWPSNLMLHFNGPLVMAVDYQDYAREVLSKLSTGGAAPSKAHDFASIGVQAQMATRFVSNPTDLGKEIVRIVEST